jgi:hypothetical protein
MVIAIAVCHIVLFFFAIVQAAHLVRTDNNLQQVDLDFHDVFSAETFESLIELVSITFDKSGIQDTIDNYHKFHISGSIRIK